MCVKKSDMGYGGCMNCFCEWGVFWSVLGMAEISPDVFESSFINRCVS